jgi:CMP-N-acetylneuraminic acid synthetase
VLFRSSMKAQALKNIREVRILSAISVSTDDEAIRDTAQRMMKDIHERSRHEEAPAPF